MLDTREDSGTLEQQVQAIYVSSESTEKESEGLQVQLEMNLERIRGHVMARTTPEEYELDQSSREFKRLASPISKMWLDNAIPEVRMQIQQRDW